MLTIDEYIAKMKKADKMDEFDYLKQSENMAAVIKYVMTYFNEYMTLETCDAEAIKMKHKRDKLEQEIESKYPKSKEFILDFYLRQRIGIHKEVKKWLEELDYYPFFYSEDDFSSAASDFCADYKLKSGSMDEYRSDIQTLMAEIKQCDTEEPGPSEMIHLDSSLVKWVRDTYRQYGVNLFAFAYDHAYSYDRRYVKYERGELVSMLAACGIAIVFLPHIGGSFLHGATFYDGGKIVMGLTVRGKDADRFWFSLFHEIAHIIYGHIGQPNGTSDADESAADEFAKETLIPSAEFDSFIAKKDFTKSSLVQFANMVEIDAGIVVGRLQKEGYIEYSWYNDLKTQYKIIA